MHLSFVEYRPKHNEPAKHVICLQAEEVAPARVPVRYRGNVITEAYGGERDDRPAQVQYRCRCARWGGGAGCGRTPYRVHVQVCIADQWRL